MGRLKETIQELPCYMCEEEKFENEGIWKDGIFYCEECYLLGKRESYAKMSNSGFYKYKYEHTLGWKAMTACILVLGVIAYLLLH